MNIGDINLDDLTHEQLKELQKIITDKKRKKYYTSDEFLKYSIKRTLRKVDEKSDCYGEDFLDDIAEELERIRKIKSYTEE